MVLPMYIINQRISGYDHYLSNAILLSPAGIHRNTSNFVRLSGAAFHYGLSLFINHIAVPNLIVDVGSKIVKDIKNMPATRDLMAFLSSRVLGGQ
jgi:hypothetical protein